jgi:hypothetical protein
MVDWNDDHLQGAYPERDLTAVKCGRHGTTDGTDDHLGIGSEPIITHRFSMMISEGI